MKRSLALLIGAFILIAPHHVFAAGFTDNSIKAVVIVKCADRQGSGTVINSTDKYVLTNAHVVMDTDTQTMPTNCQVGFLDHPSDPPRYYYRANIIKSVFEPEGNLDFAILQITQPLSVRGIQEPFPMLKTDEFSHVGEEVHVAGYSGDHDHLVISDGTIHGFEQGFIQISAPLSPGNSGGSAVNAQNELIGIPTRIVTITSEDQKVVETRYELVDIRAVMNWLDLYGENEHDKYFTHADHDRYHLQEAYVHDANLGCTALVKLETNSSVYCLLTNNERLVFPNSATFRSWYPNFTNIFLIRPEQLGTFRIKENARFKPGTLVKSATSPRVYVVIDNQGTLRWIPTEEKAISLWGSTWAGLVKDIPDEFWFNYRISSTPIE